jgi:low-density lipoprotein receptor-related protein 1 (alpha-2-macroglobulin receptor)
LTNCTDQAYGPDCQAKAAAGQCDSILYDSKPVKFYCPKSCNACGSNTALTCSNLANKCSNGGVCSVTTYFQVQSIKCTCGSNFQGSYCQTAITATSGNPCSSNPCMNGGFCQVQGSSFICSCSKSYSGLRCQVPAANPCLSYPCQNGGTCVALSTTQYYCSCLTNYYGTNCEYCIITTTPVPTTTTATTTTTTRNPCLSFNCLNGGYCQNWNGSPYCICPQNYFGTYCENVITTTPTTTTTTTTRNPCLSFNCLNGGYCQNWNGSPYCICPQNYFGTYCESVITTQTIPTPTTTRNPCLLITCQNGGYCQNFNGQAYCTCQPNYYGTYCEYFFTTTLPTTTPVTVTRKNPCLPNPCLNNGYCLSYFSSNEAWLYACQCQQNFYGNNCENYYVSTTVPTTVITLPPPNPCQPSPCYNGGTCM